MFVKAPAGKAQYFVPKPLCPLPPHRTTATNGHGNSFLYGKSVLSGKKQLQKVSVAVALSQSYVVIMRSYGPLARAAITVIMANSRFCQRSHPVDFYQWHFVVLVW